ncbi:MAG TPA: molybdenum cofactor guanylyltransferase MobA [Rhizobiaceae bacterium]|nr:molybdenum cofactor guanylyltransferase MobA [Rhizobiaceae bacterium]
MNVIAGIILAGGRSRRMGGGDKCLRRLGGRPLLRHVIDRLAPQAGPLAISANGDPSRFAEFSVPVVPDTIPGFAGPLAGVLAGMEWARRETDATWLVSVASDTPFFPTDLVSRLATAADQENIVVASSGGRRHPVFALWPVTLAPALRAFLEDGATYKVSTFVEGHESAVVDFAMIEATGGDPFFNVNTQEDLAVAEGLIRAERTS